MPNTPESLERIARLETKMEDLTKQLEKAVKTIETLTFALHELQGGMKAARWVGGLFILGGFAVISAAWQVYVWVKGAQ